MGNLYHDECYCGGKTTQKSGYGELTRKIPPLEKGDTGGFLKSPLNPLFTKEGNEHPHPFPPPSEGEDVGGGKKYKIIPLV